MPRPRTVSGSYYSGSDLPTSRTLRVSGPLCDSTARPECPSVGTGGTTKRSYTTHKSRLVPSYSSLFTTLPYHTIKFGFTQHTAHSTATCRHKGKRTTTAVLTRNREPAVSSANNGASNAMSSVPGAADAPLATALASMPATLPLMLVSSRELPPPLHHCSLRCSGTALAALRLEAALRQYT